MENKSFSSLVKEYQQIQNSKNRVRYDDYFKTKEDSIDNNPSNQEVKIDQAKTICTTMYGIDKLTEAAQKMQLIQGTINNESKFDELEREKKDISEFTNENSEFVDDSKKLLTKYLWLYHYNKIQKMPIELYKMLSSENCEEVQKANETIKSFASLYEKHPNQFHIDNLIDNNKIIEAAKKLLFAFDIQYNTKSDDEKKHIIENSINAAAFLMNYNHLFVKNELKKDPFFIYGTFLLFWKDVINERIEKVNYQDDQNKIPFSSEVEDYFKARFILRSINPKNNKFAQKLIPNISAQNLENELETMFLKVKEEVINSFYFVQDNYFTGSFFECQIDNNNNQYENEFFESNKISSIAIIIKIREFIDKFISNSEKDYDFINVIGSILKSNSDEYDMIKEFKTKVVKDVSSILLFYFNKDKKMPPPKMLETLLQILYVVFDPYYEEAFKCQVTVDPIASVIFIIESRQVLPLICSAWSNHLLSDIKKGQSDILESLKSDINNIFKQLPEKWQNKIFDNCNLSESNIIKTIEKSLVGIVVQECIDIQDSFPNKNYSESAIKLLLRYEEFIQKFLESNSNEQKVNKMARWAQQKIDEIKSSFH